MLYPQNGDRIRGHRFCDVTSLYSTHTHRFHGLFSRTTWVSRYQKGKTSLDLNEARVDGVLGRQWHQLDRLQTICTSLQTDNHISTSSLSFYRPGGLPDAQPTASERRFEVKAATTNCLQCFDAVGWAAGRASGL